MRRLAGIALASALALLAACGDGMHTIYGFMDAQGRWVVPPAYDNAFPFSEGLAAVKQDAAPASGRWGYIDAHGHWTIEPRFDFATPFSEGRAAVLIDEHWSYVDAGGTLVIAGPFHEARPFVGGIAAVEVGDKWGFVDPAGRPVIAPRFAALDDLYDWADVGVHRPCFSEGLCAASDGKLWGYIDRQGRWAVAPRFAEAGRFVEGLARVREASTNDSGKVGYIDRSGAFVIPARYESGLWFSGGRAVVVVARKPAAGAPSADAAQDRTAVMIDARGREVAEVGWGPVVETFDEAGQYLQASFPRYVADDRVPASRGRQWGYVDRQGKWVIEPRFALALPFQDGLAVVVQTDKPGELFAEDTRFGMVDATGRWVVEAQLDEVGGVASYAIPARLHERWGILDRDGRWRIEPRYRDTHTWMPLPGMANIAGGGLFRVGVDANHEWVVADPRGRIVGRREFSGLRELYSTSRTPTDRLVFAQDGTWGVTDLHLRTIVAAQFDVAPTAQSRFIHVTRQGREGCLDFLGHTVVPIEFDGLISCASDDVTVRRDTAWGTWNPQRGWRAMDPARPEPTFTCSTDRDACVSVGLEAAWVRRGQRFVLLLNGRVAPGVEPADEVADDYVAGPGNDDGAWVAKVRRGGKWGVIDERGHEWLPSRYDQIGRAYDRKVAVRRADRWEIVDSTGRVTFAGSVRELAPFNGETAIFREERLYGLVARSGRDIAPAQWSLLQPLTRHELLFAARSAPVVESEERPPVGVVDDTGKVRLPAEYTDVRSFSAALWKAQDRAGRWSLFERATGKRLAVSDLIADQPRDPSEGRAATELKRDDGTSAIGYLDAGGRIVIAPQFEEGNSGNFSGGAALVWRAGKCGLIDRAGRPLLALEYDHCQRLSGGNTIAALARPWRMPADAVRPQR